MVSNYSSLKELREFREEIERSLKEKELEYAKLDQAVRTYTVVRDMLDSRIYRLEQEEKEQ